MPAPHGSITDVDGVRVGHHQRTGTGWQTGTTCVFAPEGATPGIDVRGGGPGTRETDALRPENLIERIHAVCLTGGSAFGLAAADGMVHWLEQRGLGFPVGPPDCVPRPVVPVVPAAVIFDLGRDGRIDHRPDAGFGRIAISRASPNQARWGTVGAGTGAKAGGLQGGVGTASRTIELDRADGGTDTVVVGAVAVVNAVGSVTDPRTGLPWEHGGWALRRPPTDQRRVLRTITEERPATSVEDTLAPVTGSSLNTTIGVVATSAILDKAETSKLASVAHDGLARTVRPAHSMVDGDTVFGLATRHTPLPNERPARVIALNQLLAAGADAFADACTHAILAATTIGELLAYRDVCPDAWRDHDDR